MKANTDPPIGPNKALPKSKATVLLRPTVSCSQSQSSADDQPATGLALSRTTRYDTLADRNNNCEIIS
jgi:hypothetical protein